MGTDHRAKADGNAESQSQLEADLAAPTPTSPGQEEAVAVDGHHSWPSQEEIELRCDLQELVGPDSAEGDDEDEVQIPMDYNLFLRFHSMKFNIEKGQAAKLWSNQLTDGISKVEVDVENGKERLITPVKRRHLRCQFSI